jgi:hypothetical protein
MQLSPLREFELLGTSALDGVLFAVVMDINPGSSDLRLAGAPTHSKSLQFSQCLRECAIAAVAAFCNHSHTHVSVVADRPCTTCKAHVHK